jgi:hypothetical protein
VEVVATFDLNKTKYYREVNNLKKEKMRMLPTEAETKPTEKEI